MKNVILYILLIIMQGNAFAQGSPNVNTLSVYNSCVTAAKVCSNIRVTTEPILGSNGCVNTLVPQYFKFHMYAAGNIQLNTFSHTGTYTLYGPMAKSGIASCQMIALEQVAHVNGNLSDTVSIPHDEGYYVLRVNPTNCISIGDNYKVDISISARMSNCKEEEGPDCKDCVSSFSPTPGKYIITAWVKGEKQNINYSYTAPAISVSFVGASDSSYFTPSGRIIDGWQRIDNVVTIPNGATQIKIGLYCKYGDCSFDDIRFLPVDASMIAYVYDPVTLKLVAQLDERNYAGFYEYNDEGNLIRMKQETERGIMTTQENRSNTQKK